MSKIIQALEKAKCEGALTQTRGAPGERETLEPAGDPAEAVARESREGGGQKRRRRRESLPVSIEVPDPEVLARVDARVDALHRPMSVVSEQYRGLRSRIERLNAEGRLRSLAITSAVKGEGKSLTAANLAAVMAQDATKRILLVDADLRRPNVHALLGLEPTPGLAEYLNGAATYEDVVRIAPFLGLRVATAGRAAGHPAELLASQEFADFVHRARQEFEYVIVDTPPLHPISDVRFLTETVDGVILVVRANRTSKNVLRHAAESLPAGKIVGTVLNRVDALVESFGYRYSKGEYYYRYY